MKLCEAATSRESSMSKRPFVFGVDLDGTCADFYGGLRQIAAECLTAENREGS